MHSLEFEIYGHIVQPIVFTKVFYYVFLEQASILEFMAVLIDLTFIRFNLTCFSITFNMNDFKIFRHLDMATIFFFAANFIFRRPILIPAIPFSLLNYPTHQIIQPTRYTFMNHKHIY